jgi:hypothetical protein
LKSRLPVTWGSIRNRAIELLDPENGEFAVGMAYFRFRLGSTAAILNSRLPVTSCSIVNSAFVVLVPENVGLAVETALLSCLEDDI